MSCYIIELADCALTPYAIETESGTEYGWGLMQEAEHAVVCARCKARGSIAPDEEMAIRMWDERAGELKPDSWEKLEEDVNLGCRDYCKKYRLEECDYNMRVHMLDRAKKLAGVEEAQR